WMLSNSSMPAVMPIATAARTIKTGAAITTAAPPTHDAVAPLTIVAMPASDARPPAVDPATTNASTATLTALNTGALTAAAAAVTTADAALLIPTTSPTFKR